MARVSDEPDQSADDEAATRGARGFVASGAIAGLLAAAAALIWIVHSHFLFSWDSANYAFGFSRIDIAAHRPHPPGYLGYIFAARALAPLVAAFSGTLNLTFIVCNIVALAVATLFTARLADDGDGTGRAAVVAAATLLSSPLVLFYTSVAEIYVPEMACAAAVAWTAREALRGRSDGLYWCALAAAVTALVKLSTLVLLLPLLAYAFAAAPAARRKGPLVIFAVLLAAAGAVFVFVQPRFASLLWNQFITATARSRVVGSGAAVDAGRVFNRNVRDTLVALMAALGFNTVAFVAWIARDRTLRPDRWLAVLWAAPWLVLLLLVHVGKPGYVLPLLPLACVIVAGFNDRTQRVTGAVLAAASAACGVAWFLFVSPPLADPNDHRTYREKSIVERMASDLETLTFPTVATIRQSDAEVSALVTAASACRTGDWVVVAGSSRVDWRRAMYYLPRAVAIDIDEQRANLFVGRDGTFVPADLGFPIGSGCGLLWIASDRPAVDTQAAAEYIADVGWKYGPGRGMVSRGAITWEVAPQLARQRFSTRNEPPLCPRGVVPISSGND